MRLVVTGTGTEIGKTVAAAGLARALADRGVDVRALKPVESGVDELSGEREDGRRLARAARQDAPGEALVRLGAALAPPEAARREGVELEMDRWCRWIEATAGEAEVTIVEGAGGVLSPLTWSETTRDLARRLGAPALLVAPDRLGVLTHTLTALEALEQGGVRVLGVVYSAPAEPDPSTGGNAATLRRFADVGPVLELPRVAGLEEAAAHMDEAAGWVMGAAGGRGGGGAGGRAGREGA